MCSIDELRSVGQEIFATDVIIEQERVEQLGHGGEPDLALLRHIVLLQEITFVRHLNDGVYNAAIVVSMRQR